MKFGRSTLEMIIMTEKNVFPEIWLIYDVIGAHWVSILDLK